MLCAGYIELELPVTGRRSNPWDRSEPFILAGLTNHRAVTAAVSS